MEENETQESPLSKAYAELVEKSGDEVLIHTKTCVLWQLEHPNCVGCSSELGCGKLVKLLLTSFLPLQYQPKDFEDFLKMQGWVEGLQDKILHCSTPRELQALPTH